MLKMVILAVGVAFATRSLWDSLIGSSLVSPSSASCPSCTTSNWGMSPWLFSRRSRLSHGTRIAPLTEPARPHPCDRTEAPTPPGAHLDGRRPPESTGEVLVTAPAPRSSGQRYLGTAVYATWIEALQAPPYFADRSGVINLVAVNRAPACRRDSERLGSRRGRVLFGPAAQLWPGLLCDGVPRVSGGSIHSHLRGRPVAGGRLSCGSSLASCRAWTGNHCAGCVRSWLFQRGSSWCSSSRYAHPPTRGRRRLVRARHC